MPAQCSHESNILGSLVAQLSKMINIWHLEFAFFVLSFSMMSSFRNHLLSSCLRKADRLNSLSFSSSSLSSNGETTNKTRKLCIAFLKGMFCFLHKMFISFCSHLSKGCSHVQIAKGRFFSGAG